MTQKRIQDFGSPVVAKGLKNLSGSFSGAAVLRGNDFIVDAADRIRITPGRCITDQGVILLEDEPKFLTLTLTSTPADYTLYYDFEDTDISGGSAALLTLNTGLLTPSLVSGVILGYVRYPGGSIPLSPSHFIQSQKLQLGVAQYSPVNADWVFLIRNHGYVLTNSTGTITVTDVYDTSGSKPEMYVKFRNNTGSNAFTTAIFPFKVKSDPFSRFEIVLSADINATLTPSLVDSNGDVFVLAAAQTSITSLTLKTFPISREAVQNKNSLVYLQLQLALAPSRELKIQALGLNPYNAPI
jgi:hypothetical protein